MQFAFGSCYIGKIPNRRDMAKKIGAYITSWKAGFCT